MMLYPAMNKLTANIPNRYLLVNVVARRARQIAQQEEKAEEKTDVKPVTLAIQEVADGKLSVTAADITITNVE
ncbi:MAG: DNA-directed RNA polymerase subunit omega [Oscillospiraceae bacterium]|jgi:DNA-directed RNA polymerase subunit omega|nr:DNA-directed RNA polymerase subunit omega [Oscillospiraceae bacterium]